MEVESGAVDIIANTLKLLLECKENGEVRSKQAPPSIYMVPSVVRELSPSSFTPRVVAIGPLHRNDEHLQGFEVQKSTYLHNWLHRLDIHVPEQTLRKCAEKVIGSIERIKACYAGSMTYDDSELAKMMVIDACFILEFIHNRKKWKSSGTNKLITRSIIEDLLLIENQIPFFVLEIVFNCTILLSELVKEGDSLTKHITLLLNYYNFVEGNVAVPDSSAPDHILGYLHKYYWPAEPMPRVSKSSRKRHTAMKLDRAGMKFKPNNGDQNWALAMKLELPLPLFPWFHTFMAIPQFSWLRWPTLRMPKVYIGDESELVLRNLIVYEQSPDVKKYVTSYLMAMDMLIDTPEDVALLVKSKVLTSNFGSNHEALDMIKKLCKNIELKFLYDQQWKEMDDYHNSYWPHNLAVIVKCTWIIIALIAAFVLFTRSSRRSAQHFLFSIKGPM